MGPKNLVTSAHFISSPKAHIEKEEMSEDERRRSELPRDVAEDNPVLGKQRS